MLGLVTRNICLVRVPWGEPGCSGPDRPNECRRRHSQRMIMTTERGTAKKPIAGRKSAATVSTTAAPAAKVSTVRKASPVDSETVAPRRKPAQTAAAETEIGKPAPTRPRTAGTRKAAAKPSAEQRYRTIQAAAYFLAEKDGFQGSATHYWMLAEREIAAQLGEPEAQG